MDKKKDLHWLLMVFIGFALLWYMGRGNAKNNNDGFFLNSRSLFEKREETRNIKGTTTEDIEDSIEDSKREIAKIEKEIQRLKEEAARSPLRGLLKLSSAGSRAELSKEYVRISVSSSLKKNIDLTGLTLYSSLTGKSTRIGQAVLLPKIGSVNTAVNIEAEPGDIIFVSTGKSPLGISFRTNKCTGYLTQYQDYSPELKRKCPSPEDEASYIKIEPALSDACLEHLDNLPRCEIPKTIGDAPGRNCEEFVRSNINYNACVSNHLGDSDFPGNEWRVFLGESKELWKKEHDIIELLDKDGKIIDAVSY